jgi:hypothetical protein
MVLPLAARPSSILTLGPALPLPLARSCVSPTCHASSLARVDNIGWSTKIDRGCDLLPGRSVVFDWEGGEG